MKKYQFKTNINCSGCVAKVTPVLKQMDGLISWEVDVNSPSKILTVEAEDGIAYNDVVKAVKSVGFNIEQQ